MKMTLLELVQSVLSDLGDDYVSGTTDTDRSRQVTNIVKDTYYWLLTSREWPHLKKVKTLTSSGDDELPTHMSLDDNISAINVLRYDKAKSTDTRRKWDDVEYLYPDEFLEVVGSYNTNNSDVQEVTDPDGVVFSIKNDEAPTYWTSFDDTYIVFNSFDSAVDDTLQSSKTQVTVDELPVWSSADDYVPDLPAEAFPLLLAEAKSQCSLTLKQQANQKEEAKAQIARNRMSQKAWRAKGGIRFKNHGRRSRK